ncbi:MAG: type VI secretion system tube protein TssD [Sandaracinaceae bacterium]
MALNAYCAGTINGTALNGDVTMATIGGVDVSADHMECYEVKWGTRISTEGQAHRASSHRRIQPVCIMKRIDQTTPLLYQGLKENQRFDGTIKIFDNDPDSGETRHRFTVTLTQARLLSIESFVPDAFDADESNRPPYEVLQLVPHTITYTDEINSTEFQDEWSSAV